MLDYFRPKARHIHTIGRDLIKDDFSALIELVKNSYDADSDKVSITFNELKDNTLEITIEDSGHGMSEDIIRGNWLVPSTDYKKIEKTSPKGRILQGQKGIGRYATAVLGHKLQLYTTTEKGVTSSLSLDWNDFNSDKFLDEIHLDITSEHTGNKNGTTINILGNKEKLVAWKKNNIQNKLKIELEKLKPPFETKDTFNIKLFFFGNEKIIDDNSLVEDYFDYKIEGKIDKNGVASITYKNSDTGKEENFSKNIDISPKDEDIKGTHKFPGEIYLKLLVLDRDTGSERADISKSFGRNTHNRSVSKSYYNKYAGVSIYRGDFRIRPYGEKNYDWLNLNLRRVNNPSLRISTNQLIGYISIGNETQSNLVEASSREGLKENSYFLGLITEVRELLCELEDRRWKYRGEVGLREKKKKEINITTEIDKLEDSINNISDEDSKQKAIDEIKDLGNKFQKEKERLEGIITQYEGQVTLGKLLEITFHEISKPTQYMRENIEHLEFYIKELEKQLIGGLGEFGEKIIKVMKGYSINAKIVSDFMKNNLQPLIRKSSKPKFHNLYETIELATNIFQTQLRKSNILLEIEIDNAIEVYGYQKDYLVAMTNFIDNSIYWLNEIEKGDRTIKIESIIENDSLIIYIKDNGFGIENIEDVDDIIEPGFSRKTDGSGLGLSIAGEVLHSNNVSMEILGKEGDFNFIIKLTIDKWKK